MPDNEYMREWRKGESGQAALMKQKQRDKARRRALALLIRLHPSQWDTLFRQELERVKEEDGS